MASFFKSVTEKRLFRKPSNKDQAPPTPPLLTFQMIRKKRFSKTTLTYLFFDSCCVSYKTNALKNMKGILEYNFDLKVHFNLQKMSLTFWMKENSEEYICPHKEAFESLKVYFAQRVNLVGFHETYTAIKKIGKGNFASVFLIENKITGGLYAAKVFLKEVVFNEKNGKESIINEITIMRALSHENIIKLYEVYETNSSFYMILELLKGGNLGEYIKVSARFQAIEIIMIIKALLNALKYCHSLQIMHRDIKPENILFRREDIKEKNICIADFGLATYTTVSEYLYKKCGTPGFVAPEILKQDKFYPQKYGCSCDLFSVGVLFHILLTGKQPFIAFSYNEMIELNRECNLDYDRVFYKSLPAKALNLLQGLLDPDPALRLTADQALKHTYLTGVETLPPQLPANNNESFQGEICSEDDSGEDLKVLENNMISLRRMDRSCHLIEEVVIRAATLKDTQKDTGKGTGSTLNFKDTPTKQIFNVNLMDEGAKKNSEGNPIVSFKEAHTVQHYDPKCSIVIRVPVITGRLNSICSPTHGAESHEDFSPVLRKEIINHKEKRKELNFTLMSCMESSQKTEK